MAKRIRLLIIEDSADDRDLLLMHLQRNGIKPDYHCIESKKELKKALKEKTWDIIISDYSMPEFDGLAALRIIKESGLDIPFILISGAIGEELAVEAMKAGANDYFMKGNLHRLVPAIEREIKEAKNREKHRKAEEQRLRLLNIVQQSLNEIFIINSRSLNIEYANNIALQNLGYSIKEIKQLTPVALLENFNEQILREKLKPLSDETEDKITVHSFHKRKNGTRYPIEAHVQLIKEKEQTFYSAIVLDLTSHKRHERIIEKQKKLAEELTLSSKYKSEFLANMSHELRTPLNSIILLAKLLKDNRQQNLNEDQLDYLNVIHKSGNTLMELINDVLDISKVEAGEMSFKIKNVRVEGMCQNLKNIFLPLAKNKGLTFQLYNHLDSGFTMKSDPLRVEQVLKNFLSNAVKFTDNGCVKVTVYTPGAEETSQLSVQGKPVTAFSVKDTGIGIGNNEKEKIFEAFQQVDTSSGRRFSGTGLGLYISKEITSMLGGNITIESTPGEGSKFTVYLPTDSSSIIRQKGLEQKSEQVGHEPKKQEPETDKRGKLGKVYHILLIDDSDIHVTALKELIEDKHKVCQVAGTAREAYQILENNPVDLIVLDLGLPDADGIDVIKKIRLDYSSSELPAIIYSGRNLNDNDYLEAEKFVSRVITKTSGSFQLLIKEINRVLDIKKPLQNIKPKKGASFEDLKGKRILVVDDDQRNIYSLSKALSAFEMEIFTASDGIEALNFLHKNGPVDVVLMDMMMPNLNGYDTTKKIRGHGKWKNLPIIAVTARAMPEDRKRCIKAGATDYLSKPIDIEKLLSLLRVWVNPPDNSLFS